MFRRLVYAVFVLVLSCFSVAADPVVLQFSGRVDGSGVAAVDATSATWTNYYYGTPDALTLNGLAWDPQTNPTLDASGSPLLPTDLSGYRANVTKSSGRDSVAAEIIGNQLLVYVDDTPNGDDLYQFAVTLTPQPPPPATPTVQLHLQGRFDGSDRIVIDQSGATLDHLQWANPTDLTLNGVAWDATSDPTLPNSGATEFLSAPVLFSSAEFAKNAGRDLASYEVFDNRVELIFADSPVGDDFYDVTLTFATVPEPASISLAALAMATIVLVTTRRQRKR